MTKGAKKTRQVFKCRECGFTTVKWLGRCPECGSWDSLDQEERGHEDHPLEASGVVRTKDEILAPIGLLEIEEKDGFERYSTGMSELDRVLGGGLVPGAMILLGGEPGIGKSTLLLQMMDLLASGGLTCLYVSGEESASQIKLRASRLGIKSNLLILPNPNIETVISNIEDNPPNILAIDSIQTVYSPRINSMPGSMGQVRHITALLMNISKKMKIPVLIVGHVTKEGAIAGPKTLEHMVDTVLYFEGDRTQNFRMLRTVKNRFGPTHEIGVFEMTDRGLNEVSNPSKLFMGHGLSKGAGSVVFPAIEGTRPILVEIQALVNDSFLAMPRRTTSGIDSNRLALLVAVAEKILGVTLYDKDIFLNVVGGLKITENASDLPVICAILSSLENKPIPTGTALFGEVGLTGEVRPVTKTDIRIKEVQKLGFKRCVFPALPDLKSKTCNDMECISISKLDQIIEIFS